MPRFRSISWAILAAAGFALAIAPTAAPARQPAKDDLPKRPAGYGEVRNLQTARGITDLKKAKDVFVAFAQYNAEYISHPRVYTAPQEFRPEPPPAGSPPVPYTVDALITELNRHILVPYPVQVSGPIPSADEADYIRELGAALDAALKDVIEKPNQERIIRVNATRMLAAACRSGATAHYPTVTGLLTNPNTLPEVKYYALQAAGNLLAAYDLNNYRARVHSAKPKEVAPLIAALQDAILKPETILPIPGGAVPPDQLPVRAFFRRHAVRALAQVRFAEYKVPDGPTLYPAFTLAQVAVSAPALAPAPNEAEVAEAVLGICNMTPPRGQAAAPYAYAMADAVATGLVTFATPRAARPDDKTLPWRGTAARLNDGLKLWGALFDANYDPARPNAGTPGLAPKPVTEIITQADQRVLTPVVDGSGKIDVNGLRQVRDDKAIRGDAKWTLAPFIDNPSLVIPKKD